MAHNNGMIPRTRKSKAARGLSDNAAKFREAVEKVPVPPVGDAYDPAPPDAGIGDLPMHGATGAEVAGFVPHRPSRPEKSEGGKAFKLVSEYEPAGDQPTAIKELVEGLRGEGGGATGRNDSGFGAGRIIPGANKNPTTEMIINAGGAMMPGERDQVLLGVTGSGKTFTMAKIIEAVQRPALILAPNKTLAAQLYTEFKNFFPENAVEYFVSYYDYYQPEAYIPRTDTYIEKDSSINEEIDRMRHSATRAILERDDVIIVASVSCIYGIGSVET